MIMRKTKWWDVSQHDPTHAQNQSFSVQYPWHTSDFLASDLEVNKQSDLCHEHRDRYRVKADREI
jgi:hypothetical protein